MKNVLLPLAILIAFSAYTLLVMTQADQSLLQFGLQLMASADTAQVVIDLYIMASLACVWMVQDNRARGKTTLAVVPYLLLTLVFVSVGPLLYLVLRNWPRSRGPACDRFRGPVTWPLLSGDLPRCACTAR